MAGKRRCVQIPYTEVELQTMPGLLEIVQRKAASPEVWATVGTDRHPAGTDRQRMDEITAGLRAFARAGAEVPESIKLAASGGLMVEESPAAESPVSLWASVALIGLLVGTAVWALFEVVFHG